MFANVGFFPQIKRGLFFLRTVAAAVRGAIAHGFWQLQCAMAIGGVKATLVASVASVGPGAALFGE